MEIYLADPSGVGMVLPKYGRNSREYLNYSFWVCT